MSEDRAILGTEIGLLPLPKPKFLFRFGLFVFFFSSISFLEFVYGFWTYGNMGNYFFPVLFALNAAAVFFLLSISFSERINRFIAFIITSLLVLLYAVQLVYFEIFHAPLSLYSILGAGDAMDFQDVAFSAIFGNKIALSLLFLPLLVWLGLSKKMFSFSRPKISVLGIIFLAVLGSYDASLLGLYATRGKDFSQYSLYYKTTAPILSVQKLGLLTTERLDLENLLFGNNEDGAALALDIPPPPLLASPSEKKISYNILNIDFQKISEETKNSGLLGMHSYFSSQEPTKKNEYTGMFKGNNLIFFIAESFSPYALSPELTPTLYKMSHEGFIFPEFYNPAWGVSTSDGEYVPDTGLIPKPGVWSMLESNKNDLPFAMGNQFKKLGYITKAYHDHTYTYYGRDTSIPNLGYTYKGLGSGVNIQKTWPESDLEMINATAYEYVKMEPFHVYYVTVSGHMNYNFYGHYIAAKNRTYVESLPYSETAKAYIAANLEFEFAMEALLKKLEAAGTLDNTVIAIVPDHYPYGLPKENIDELAGHKVEENFELYKSIFILWKKGLGPITVNKPASTLDVLPTISNLFGLDYDSRLMMGQDILSDSSPLVLFPNRSWITEKGSFNSMDPSENDQGLDADYVKNMNKIVEDKFRFSTKILDTNYYNKVVPR